MFIENFLKKFWLKAHPQRDSRRKSLTKAVSWRIVGTVDTIILSWIITGTLKVAVSIGTLELLTKTILYYFHERLWANINVVSYEELDKKD